MSAPNKIPEPNKSRVAAILWFLAAACSLTAAVLNYLGDKEIKWGLLAATIFMTVLGVNTLRRSRRMQ